MIIKLDLKTYTVTLRCPICGHLDAVQRIEPTGSYREAWYDLAHLIRDAADWCSRCHPSGPPP